GEGEGITTTPAYQNEDFGELCFINPKDYDMLNERKRYLCRYGSGWVKAHRYRKKHCQRDG
ncbi:MAG: hypothetical protein K2P25_04725, partial [Lachnospiraceae bacterium]|nr:hypothetical protein [Lachnospiraceae bacterium]